ncbi:MAG: hypothetical protein ACUVTH_03685 [Thermogutta sp.]
MPSQTDQQIWTMPWPQRLIPSEVIAAASAASPSIHGLPEITDNVADGGVPPTPTGDESSYPH